MSEQDLRRRLAEMVSRLQRSAESLEFKGAEYDTVDDEVNDELSMAYSEVAHDLAAILEEE
ncbi:MAG TPA: hypothetical protein VIV12_23065 [Streptosporangiaceae bacterium]